MAIYTRAQQKHDIEAKWLKAENFIPLAGEIIYYDADENYTFTRTKVGNGVTNINNLPFSGTQIDWDQSDTTAADYIKNRTHYTKETQTFVSKEVRTLHQNFGSGAGLETGLVLYNDYYTSDEERIAALREFLDMIDNSTDVTLRFGNEYSCQISTFDFTFGSQLDLPYIALNLSDGNVVSLMADEFNGFDVEHASDTIAALLEKYGHAFIEYNQIVEEVIPLEEKYIPDTIARKADIDNLVNSAPAALDTLKELSQALGDDPNFSTTILNKLNNKVDKIAGKGLSSNDYTTAEKNKLAGIETGAQKNIRGDWNQTNELADDFIKNRTHYFNQSVKVDTFFNSEPLGYDGYQAYAIYWSPNGLFEAIKKVYEKSDYSAIQIKFNSQNQTVTNIVFDTSFDYGRYSCQLANGEWVNIEANYFSYETAYKGNTVTVDLTITTTVETLKQLDEKFIPDTIARKNDLFNSIDLLKILNVSTVDVQQWPLKTENFINLLQNSFNNMSETDKQKVFNYFYTLFMESDCLPIFVIKPTHWTESYRSTYKKLCATTNIELDSITPDTGSSIDEDFNLTYYISLSPNETLKMHLYYDKVGEGSIAWGDLDDIENAKRITFSLVESGYSSPEAFATMAQEHIITPALSEEVY